MPSGRSTTSAASTNGSADDGRGPVVPRGRFALLGWVHAAEADSFLRAHERYGARPLDPVGYDAYVADTARVAEALGVSDPPRDRRELSERLIAYRPELRATSQARAAARFLLFQPPLPLAVRPFYGALAANAVALLPPWARGMLWLPRVPVVEDLAVRPTGQALTRTIRWAMTPPHPSGRAGEVRHA
ncbi:hypothetical protein STRIP9103_00124 [Streptomyces ipomoeae 91-03]|uniref:ER-bound oxygenase mpaB/mpaB'/Rubber oxygenase catalytic domain-containing protein n=1 Tax=Streptomyces ipomoeae 91-03 TaxID=698759 RepID=L1KVJ2_9ACTN|nr:hypothetical protein STRIP9103_00124 [Streptomyces ipomoeae 91-03]